MREKSKFQKKGVDFMFYSKIKKEALKKHETAVKEYNTAYSDLESICTVLYSNRTESISVLSNIETLINSIANTPKEFEKHLANIKIERECFKETEKFAKDASETLKKSSMGAAAGIAGGTAVVTLAPTAAMWIATTFGTASTGTAISALSGAAATNAALAWLGGGALAAGGAGMTGGSALLALAGPIGWGIAGISTATSLFFVGKKNKKVVEQAVGASKHLQEAISAVNQQISQVRTLSAETNVFLQAIKKSYKELNGLNGKNYLELSTEEQMNLGILVNNAISVAELLNKMI